MPSIENAHSCALQFSCAASAALRDAMAGGARKRSRQKGEKKDDC